MKKFVRKIFKLTRAKLIAHSQLSHPEPYDCDGRMHIVVSAACHRPTCVIARKSQEGLVHKSNNYIIGSRLIYLNKIVIIIACNL